MVDKTKNIQFPNSVVFQPPASGHGALVAITGTTTEILVPYL